MLILTRQIGETLIIGDEVNVSVLGVSGNQVRIGVRAPKNISVHREEIFNRIQLEKNQEQGDVKSSVLSTEVPYDYLDSEKTKTKINTKIHIKRKRSFDVSVIA